MRSQTKQQVSMHVSIKEFSDASSERIAYYEEIGNWRNIIFLPNKMLWKIIVMLTTVINCNLVSYIILFQANVPSHTWTVYYVFEGVYFLNTILILLHRFMRYRKTRAHSPKNVYLIFCDIVSLVPYYELYYLLMKTSYGDVYEFTKDYTRVKVFLRLFTVFAFFVNANNEPGLDHLLATTVLQVVMFSLFCAIFSGLWYEIGNVAFPEGWMGNLKYHYFNNESHFHWWVICNNFVSNSFVHNWSGVITAESNLEHVIVVLSMIIGCLMHIVFYSNLTSLYIKQISNQYYFSYRLYVIINLLERWGVGSSLKKSVIYVYNTFWEKRYGRSKMPTAFYRLLPLTLQKDVCLDTYWHFFRHSHFFNDTDTEFNRNVCLSMKCQFYMPGEYLCAKGDMKNKIVYIVTGVIQLLSKDDQSSPVISFSSGTVLGEISCLLTLPSISNLRCATYCEVQILELRALALTMVKYKSMSKMLWMKLNGRLDMARKMQHPELVKLKSKEEKRTSIRWFKNQWRQVSEVARHSKKGGADKHIQVNPHHFSKYLSLYALSNEVELKVSAICLTSHCPLILDPTSTFKKSCDYVVLGVIVVQSLILPYCIVFRRELKTWHVGLLYTLDVIYFLSLYLDTTTAIKTKDRLTVNICEIIIFKGKNISTMIDIFSTIPLELFGSMVSGSQRLNDLLHLNRVLKIHKLISAIRSAQLNVWVDYTKIRLLKYILFYVLSLYFLTCILFGMACFVECDKLGWYFYNKILRDLLSPIVETEEPSKFVRTLHHTTSVLMGLTWREYFSYSIPDMLVELLVSNFGYYLVSFCFAEMAACAVMNLKHEFGFREYFNSLKYFCERNNISTKLTEWMYKAVDCNWQYSNGFEIHGRNSVIKHMPNYLKHNVLTSRIISCLRKVPLFGTCSEQTLKELAYVCTVTIFPPDVILARSETRVSCLYVILNGYCRAESSIPTDKYHESFSILSYGDCFPVMEVLLNIDNFLNVTSITSLELITMNFKDLIHKLVHFSDIYSDLMVVLDKHIDENKIVLTRMKGRLPDMTSSQKSKGPGVFFQYRCIDEAEWEEEEVTEFYNTFKILGKWKFIRHIFLRKTIEPTSKIYVRWERSRCTVSILQVIYTLTLMKFAIGAHWHRWVELIFLSVGLVDFYIRMHVRYYNEKGILVSHPLYTAGHYLGTSFSLDLAGIFPVHTFHLNVLFGTSRKLHTLVLMMMVTRSLQLYRVYKGICYAQSQGTGNISLVYENLKYIVVVFVVTGGLALLLESITCNIESDDNVHICPNNSWIVNHNFLEGYKSHTTTLVTYYAAFTVFASSSLGTFEFAKHREMIMILCFTLLLSGLKWYVLAKITSSWIGGNMMLVQYQHNMNVFLQFGRLYRISNELTSETINHYEYVWDITRGCNVSQILTSLHPVLKTDFCQFLYAQYFSMSEVFFDAEISVIRHICHLCTEVYYKKDAVIIRCNDVNDMLYIVCKGQVEVTIAGFRLCILNSGAMFGCLLPYGFTRQTITVNAMVHTSVLAIQSDTFTRALSVFPHHHLRMKRARVLGTEYLLPKPRAFLKNLTTDSEQFSASGVGAQEELTMTKKKRFLIHAENFWYQLFNYVINVHLAALSTIILSVMIISVGQYDIASSWSILMHAIDVVYISKFIVGLHLMYYDKTTGILVTNHDLIRKKYISSFGGFWLDLITLVPMELCFLWSRKMYRLCWINRLFRFMFMFKYYGKRKNRLTVSKHQRWTYLLYIMLLLMHATTCVWWLIACPGQVCVYNNIMPHEPYEHKILKDPEHGFWMCFLHVVNIFTTTGLKNMSPNTTTELAAMIFMIAVAQVNIVALTVGFANMLVLHKFVMSEYERKANHIVLFMQTTNVSASLKNKVWLYFVELWTKSYGSWLPKLVKDAPKYIKEGIMNELYRNHINSHTLLKELHIDLVRQVVNCLEPQNFMPGMYIAEKGDVDASMYFIQKGEVIVYDKHGNNEIEQVILGPWHSFGEAQGIYAVPHDRSYKARFQCQVLILQRDRWIHYLKWFPASKIKIQEYMLANYRNTGKLIV